MTASEAMGLLGLEDLASPEAVATAFKAKVKTASPDHGGGDPDLFRRVIEAYRLLQKLNAARAAMANPSAAKPAAEQVINISIKEALGGLRRRIRLPDGSRAPVSLPPGLRNDDTVRLKQRGLAGADLMLRVRIAPEPRGAITGDDLWLTVDVDRRVLEQGGRIEVETPSGKRTVWIRKGLPADGRLRVRGHGLPARGDHPPGDLYVRPVAVDAPAPEDDARSRLGRFRGSWTPAGL